MRYVRWAAVLPAALVAWHFALFLGVAALSFLESFCPPELVISGMCTASWFPTAEKIVFWLAAALAAGLIVVSVGVVAPAKKVWAAYASLLFGSAIALWLAVETHAWGEFVSAVLAGGITVLVVRRVVAPLGR